jgi:hypothetical protein
MEKKLLYIRDDLGEAWTFDGTRVYCVSAEEEAIREGYVPEDNGYPCASWGEAIEILNDEGYITAVPVANFAIETEAL